MLTLYTSCLLKSLVRRFALWCLLLAMVSVAQAQTQASCTFTTFALQSPATGGKVLLPSGVNDYATVVGEALDLNTYTTQGFTRWSNGGLSFYSVKLNGSAVDTAFADRNDNGVTIGGANTPFLLQGSTFTPLTVTIGTTTHSTFLPTRMNKWGTIVGFYVDSSGTSHGFKRWSNGQGIALDFPGAKETLPFGINDSGTIVGSYSTTLSPKHGFIYHNGQWATLDYPSSTLQTGLRGISNAGVIIGETSAGETFHASFIYENSAFKVVALPNTQYPSVVSGISLVRGLLAGWSSKTGFIATCK